MWGWFAFTAYAWLLAIPALRQFATPIVLVDVLVGAAMAVRCLAGTAKFYNGLPVIRRCVCIAMMCLLGYVMEALVVMCCVGIMMAADWLNQEASPSRR